MDELLRRMCDLAERSSAKNTVTHGNFIKMSELEGAERCLAARGVRYLFSGGIPEAERVVFFALPDWLAAADFHAEDYLSAVAITVSDGVTYFHRDYLGAMMALGLERKTGVGRKGKFHLLCAREK